MFKPCLYIVIWSLFFVGLVTTSLTLATLVPVMWLVFAATIAVYVWSTAELIERFWPPYLTKHRA